MLLNLFTKEFGDPIPCHLDLSLITSPPPPVDAQILRRPWHSCVLF